MDPLSPETARTCPDPECAGTAEPERDDDMNFWQCGECGYTFGYRRITTTATIGTCQVGIPDDIRRRAQPAAPLLQIGHRDDYHDTG